MSNRGEDTIAVLAIEPGTGRIRLTQSMPCGGKTPRFFALAPDGRFMHVLNEDSDSILTMVVDEHSGMLTAMGRKLLPQLLSSTWIFRISRPHVIQTTS